MITIVITDYIVKNQVFNGIKPKVKDPLIKSLVNKIKTKDWIVLNFKNYQVQKLYVKGTQYRAVIQTLYPDVYLLVYFRSKGDRYSKNISSDNDKAAEKIVSNLEKANEHLKQGKAINLQFK